MASKSIFDLKEQESQLESYNQGCSNLKYETIAPTRAVSSSTFANGSISFKFSVDGTTWWNPSKSFLIADSTLTDESGTQLVVADNIGYSMNTLMNLFSSAEIRVNDKSIEKIDNFLPQISAMKMRNNKSGSWLNTIGKGTNNWIPNINERINEVSSDGISSISNVSGTVSGSSAIYAQGRHGGLNIPAVSYSPLSYQQTVISNLPSGSNAFTYINTPGAEGFRVNKAGRYLVTFFAQCGNYAGLTYTVKLAKNGAIAPAPLVPETEIGPGGQPYDTANAIDTVQNISLQGVFDFNLNDVVQLWHKVTSIASNPAAFSLYLNIVEVGGSDGTITTTSNPSRRITGQELVAQPPLSIFDLDHALPAGNYELVLTPYNDYKKKGIESSGADKTAGASGDYLFDINTINFVVNTIQGPRVTDKEYLIDLKEVSCQTQNCDANTAVQTKQFDVPPSTNALDIAFQSTLEGTNTLWSPSKFRTASNVERTLNYLLITYGGQTVPPDGPYNPNYTANAADDRGKLYNIHQLNTGGYFDPAGSESYNDWANENGLLVHSAFVKDGSNTDGRATVKYAFSSTPTNTKVLVFTHSYRTVRVKIMDGRVVDIRTTDD